MGFCPGNVFCPAYHSVPVFILATSKDDIANGINTSKSARRQEAEEALVIGAVHPEEQIGRKHALWQLRRHGGTLDFVVLVGNAVAPGIDPPIDRERLARRAVAAAELDGRPGAAVTPAAERDVADRQRTRGKLEGRPP